MSEPAETAKLIRKELKEKFPNIKFSVTSKSYSGGSSVDIHWFNGVPAEQINAIVAKYEYGHFDGLTDLYEMSNVRDDIPQVKYIFAQREITQDKKDEMQKKLEHDFGIDFSNEQEVFTKFHSWPQQVIYRQLADKTF